MYSSQAANSTRDDADSLDLTERRGKRSVAGIVSAILHAVGLVLIALLWTGTPMGRIEEPPRDVGIRLVQSDTAPSRPFDEVAAAETSAADSDAVASEALPEASPSSALSELPSLDAVGAPELPGYGALPGFGDAGGGRAEFPDLDDGTAEFLAQEKARMAASLPKGTPSDVTLFGGSPATGRSFVFAIDRSQSMGAEGIGALDAAAAELSRAVAGLNPTNRFQIVAYNRDAIFLDGDRKMLPVNDASAAMVKDFVTHLAAFGPTEHPRALLSALALRPEAVYLLTDGGDPGLNDGEIAQIARVAGGKTTIHVVCFGRKAPSKPGETLRRLAEACGGGFTFVDLSARR